MKTLRLAFLAALLLAPLRASAADLIMNGGTMTLAGVNTYGTVSLTNGAKIIVPPYMGNPLTGGNLVIKADSITIDATSSITAKGAGYQGKLCGDGPGPAAFTASGGRGGCAVRDSGGGGAHFGSGGRGTRDNPTFTAPSFVQGYEEDCINSLNAGGTACSTVTDCRNQDGLPTIAGQGFFHSVWATEFGAAGGDKGCRDGDGFVNGGYGPKFLAAGNGGGRIQLEATNAGQTGVLTMNGLIRADGNRGCSHGNDSGGGGAGGGVLLVGDTVNIGATAVVSAKGGRGGDAQPKCLTCAVDGDCNAPQTCVGGRCSPCNCTPCPTGVVVGAACPAIPGTICRAAGGALGNICATNAAAPFTCPTFDPTDDESECIGNQNYGGGCDDCGGGGGGGIINVLSRTRTINVSASFDVRGATGGICPVCTGEAGGGAGEVQIDGAYVGELCDGFDNDVANGTDDTFTAMTTTCGLGSCATQIPTCTAGSPPTCVPTNTNASCECPRGTSRPRIALLLDSSSSMLQNLAGTVTFGDGSQTRPGIDTNADGKPNDSKLFIAKDAVSQLIAAYPEIDFALARYHQDEGANRSCQTSKWLECQSVCCSYDNPQDPHTGADTCTFTLPRQLPGVGNIVAATKEDSPLSQRCVNYAGTCGTPRRGADILVGFESDVRQYMSWLDGGETGFNASATSGNYCGGLTGDCELRGSGPTPIAESLRALYDYMTPLKVCDQAAACRDYSVLFVSDGAEECGGNPAAAAAELLAKNIKTYVIGVSVNATQAINLQAIAVAGGTANYIPVTSSAQLLPALVSIVSGSIRTELCNTIDDNCNGVIDEGYNLGAACDNGLQGICKGTGTIICDPADNKKSKCNITSPGMPSTGESCNGKDDNCNGQIDEGNPGGGVACGSAVGACKQGVTKCIGGVLTCTGQTGGTPEVCDGVDNDCNNIIDDCVTGIVGSCDGAPCGSAIGECKPGTFKCMGMAGYVCQGGTGGSSELCNGKDDDCNGAIDDNVPGTGGACTTDGMGKALCKPGTVRCIGGALVCQGGIAFHPPACTCPPDDCSLPSDGGMTGTDGCPTGSACIGCACRTPCAAGEFPCSSSTVCRDGFCVPPECGGVLCKSFEDCIGNKCVDKCAAITCNDGLVCHEGDCVSNDCYGLGCMAGQICRQGQCIADPCAGVTCTGDQFCRDGTCVGNCETVFCGGIQKCQDGLCVDDPCKGKCTSSQTCNAAGLCVDNVCPQSCGMGRVCLGGSCVDDPCANITCPGDPLANHCDRGQCVPNTPVPEPSPPDRIVGAGGGGFSCDVSGHAAGSTAPMWSLFALLGLLVLRRRRA